MSVARYESIAVAAVSSITDTLFATVKGGRIPRSFLARGARAVEEVVEGALGRVVGLVWPDATKLPEGWSFQNRTYQIRVTQPVHSAEVLEVAFVSEATKDGLARSPGISSPLSACGAFTELRLYPPISHIAFEFHTIGLQDAISEALRALVAHVRADLRFRVIACASEANAAIARWLDSQSLAGLRSVGSGYSQPPFLMAVSSDVALLFSESVWALDLVAESSRGGTVQFSPALHEFEAFAIQIGRRVIHAESGEGHGFDMPWQLRSSSQPTHHPILTCGELRVDTLIEDQGWRLVSVSCSREQHISTSSGQTLRDWLGDQIEIVGDLLGTISERGTSVLLGSPAEIGGFVMSLGEANGK